MRQEGRSIMPIIYLSPSTGREMTFFMTLCVRVPQKRWYGSLPIWAPICTSLMESAILVLLLP